MKSFILFYQDSDAVDMALLMVAGEVPEYDVPHRAAGEKTISSSSTRKSDETLHILSTFLDSLITPIRHVP